MRSIADEAALATLVERLLRVTPETKRRWGTLDASEMLCHVADANEGVLGVRVPESTSQAESAQRRHPFLKWLALRSPMPWPKGLPTGPGADPKLEGTRPGDFDRDRERAVESLRRLAAAMESELERGHPAFGPMTRADWMRWAYRHHDHHLRQFGL